MIKKFIHIIMLLLVAQTFVLAQAPSWAETAAPKRGAFVIPKEVSLELPTDHSVLIGVFILENDLLTNVGQGIYDSTQDLSISLGYDVLGNIGLSNGDSLITLIRDTVTEKSYVVEFIYESGREQYEMGVEHRVSDVRKSSWNWMSDDLLLCTYHENVLLNIPYGVTKSLGLSSGVIMSGDTIFLTDMVSGNYTITAPVGFLTFEPPLVSFEYVEFPVQELNQEVQICQDSTFRVLEEDVINGIIREFAMSTSSFELGASGTYYYTATSMVDSSCTIMDTVNVDIVEMDLTNIEIDVTDEGCDQLGSVNIDTASVVSGFGIAGYVLNDISYMSPKIVNLNQGNYELKIIDEIGCASTVGPINVFKQLDCEEHQLFDPLNPETSNYIFFEDGENARVFNKADQEVIQITGPQKWLGLDKNGQVLPVGVYFVIYEDGSSITVTIVH